MANTSSQPMETPSATSLLEASTPVLCEFGNSSLKLRYHHHMAAFPYEQQWEERAATLLASLSQPLLLYVATVAPRRTRQFVDALRYHNLPCFLCPVAELLPPANPLLPYTGVSGIGIDRLLGLLGARRLFAPPLFTVDCGTAVTVNVLSPEGRCVGGAIFADAPLQLHALATGTEALPRLEFSPPATLRIGTTTEEALQNGTLASVVGGIVELLRAFTQQLSCTVSPPLVLTGGHSHAFLEHLRTRWSGPLVHRPHLVLEGLEFVVETLPREQLWAHVQPLSVVR